MSLQLDKRHRAMLREMGVRVWLPAALPSAGQPQGLAERPMAPPADSPIQTAIPSAALQPSPRAGIGAEHQAAESPGWVAEPVTAPVQPQVSGMTRAATSWSMGAAVALYAETSKPEAGPRWLVLAETTPAALAQTPFQPFGGDAGKLLDNMLRAARLHQRGSVRLAALARVGAAAGQASTALELTLPDLVTAWKPDVVLVMGRLAGQAVLNTSEAFGKLRGRVHTVHGMRTVLTYDATYLLRSPADKARAWDDLCLALSLVAEH